MSTRTLRLFTGVMGAFFAIQGLWAFLDPRSFYDTLATFEPYHPHFLRDIGTAEIGVGVAGIVAAIHPRAVVAGLAGLTSFQALHVVSHVIDIDNGGNPAIDIPGLSILAALTAAGLVLSLRTDESRRQGTARATSEVLDNTHPCLRPDSPPWSARSVLLADLMRASP